MHCPSWHWTCLLRMPEQNVQRHTRAQGAERRKHKQWTSTECAFESGHKCCSQMLFMDYLAGKAGTKHPTKVPIGSSSTKGTKFSSKRSMEPRLEGPENIPSDIGFVLGLELAAKTSEQFSWGRTEPYLKWGKRPHRSISHAPRRVSPKIAPGDGRIVLSLAMFYARHRWYMSRRRGRLEGQRGRTS